MHPVVIVFGTFLLTARFVAQDTTTCWLDTLGHTFRDTITIGLGAGRPPNKSQAARADYLTSAQAVQSYFRQPALVRLPLWARTVVSPASLTLAWRLSQADSVYAPYGLHGHVLFRVDPTGRLADSTIAVDIASPDIRESIVAAVQRADSALAFSPPSQDVLSDRGKIRLQFVEIPNSQGTSVPLLRVVVPGIRLEEGASVVSFPQLSYPEVLREQSLGGHVVLQFVVRADGRIEANSIDLLQAEYRDFALAAIHGVEGARFQPAHIGRCKLPTIVRVPVDFKIRRGN